MADPWELILHHSYSGTPGVIFDQSPGRGAHGRAIDIADDQFLRDGTESGSGLIDFRPGGLVRVSCSGPWRRVEGMRVEVACLGDPGQGGNLLVGDKFSFGVGNGLLTLYMTGDGGILSDVVHAFPVSMSLDSWTTVGFVHDGFSRFAFTQDGAVIYNHVASNLRMGRTRTLTIGASSGAAPQSFAGLIDDVKIWRINPHRVDEEFVNRPMDRGTRACWKRWTDALAAATRNDPDCMRRVITELRAAVRSLQTDGTLTSGTTRRAWQQASESYRSLWSQGDLGGALGALTELVDTLGTAQINPIDDSAVQALYSDPCLKAIAAELPSLDCDPDFTGLIDGLRAAMTDPGHVG